MNRSDNENIHNHGPSQDGIYAKLGGQYRQKKKAIRLVPVYGGDALPTSRPMEVSLPHPGEPRFEAK
jgi:hypothetical protein